MTRVAGSFRRPLIVVLYVQPFLLMGAFVALYNYIGFRLEAPPFLFSTTAVAMLYFSYLAGTWSSARTGAWVQRWGFRRTLLLSQAAMLLGIGVTILPIVPVIIAGVVILTAGFFASHSAVAAWIPLAAPDAAGEASAVYSLSYYLGSSVLGWLVGFVFIAGGWPATVVALVGVVVLAAVLALTVRSRGSVQM